ncbi:hypothetical protein PC116_g14756 [Phytophthora cactorum]|uniref:Uncharacterized protein n=1 Tax=Phytophthora cactorum TaxID=29920 RepID=A0A8T1KJH1_9STRA|nr:hypothetical protein PC113_g16326 [Phytophthora cactorum]KAG2889922.1 hypothetical protein PC114_g17710 [Phytophthora cactorum]KAG2902397.1 hypothetical protein PC115_g15602 [Phytophthora cactorum]KAG4237174.1 hypothetical protein PC116_g14756 [Phytophthora cactorum]
MSRQASIGVSAPRPGSKTPGYSNLLSHTRQKHPDFEAIMVASDTGTIVQDPEFETACVSALRGESESLPAGQRRLLQPFESWNGGDGVRYGYELCGESPEKEQRGVPGPHRDPTAAIYPTNL